MGTEQSSSFFRSNIVLKPALLACMVMEQRIKASDSSESLQGSWSGSTWRRKSSDHNGVAPAGRNQA